MSHFTLKNTSVSGILFLLLIFFFMSPIMLLPARAGEPVPHMQTIPSEEIKDKDADEALKKVSLEQVEHMRTITDERTYGLAAFWLLIVLGIVLLRYQVRDDEKLYKEGYYNKDIE
jgi:hypothetical protein